MVGMILLAVSLVFAFLVYMLAAGMDWPKWMAVLLALVPVGAVLFAGIFGFLGAALFVGAMYKASSAM